MSRQEIENKFLELAATRIPRENAGMLLDMVQRLDEVDDVSRILDLLRSQE